MTGAITLSAFAAHLPGSGQKQAGPAGPAWVLMMTTTGQVIVNVLPCFSVCDSPIGDYPSQLQKAYISNVG